MSENKAIYLKTINFSAQFISVQQGCAKINSARNIAEIINIPQTHSKSFRGM